MDEFLIITNHIKDPRLEHTGRIKAYLESKGKVCYVQDCAEKGKGNGFRYTDARTVPNSVDCALVLGGDGTLLQAARDLIDTGIPLLGINLGTLGYLAEIEITNVEDALDKLIAGEYSVEERMMLDGHSERQGRVLMQDLALNDIVVARRGHLRVIDFKIYVNDTFLLSYRADGIILSTPTGSTGYSLSVGGPLVSPDASLMILTAIAPHTLTSRPVILPDDVDVTVEIGGRSIYNDEGAEVTFDGDVAMNVNAGDRICITRSEKKTKLIKINNTSFVEILRKKMN